VTTSPLVLAVNPSTGIKSVPELIAAAKKDPGKLNYSTSGNGSAPHLGAALFSLLTGTEMTHVPYRGGALAIQSVMAGDTQVTFGTSPSVLPQASGGRCAPSRSARASARRWCPTCPACGSRPARVQPGVLVRHVRAGRHAAGHRQEDPRCHGHGHAAAVGEGGAGPRRHRGVAVRHRPSSSAPSWSRTASSGSTSSRAPRSRSNEPDHPTPRLPCTAGGPLGKLRHPDFPETRMPQRLTAQDFDQELLILFDAYVHGAVDRRGFLAGAQKFAKAGVTAAGLLAALSPNFAAGQQVKPDDNRLKTETITVPRPRATAASRATSRGPRRRLGQAATVLVIHENRGLNPHIEDITRRLALDGFMAFAPDALTPLGGYPGDEDKARDAFAKLDQAKTREDFLASVAG
jgi:hypothetical protein